MRGGGNRLTGEQREKVLRKGKQVVTPSAQPASQPFAVSSCASDVRSCAVTNSQGLFTAHCAAEKPTSIEKQPWEDGGRVRVSQQQQQGKNVLDRLTLRSLV